MGHYAYLRGRVRLSPASYRRARATPIDDASPLGALLDSAGTTRHDGVEALSLAIETKREHLFEGVVRVLSFFKDQGEVDELSHSREFEPRPATLYQLLARRYRELHPEDRRVVYNLHRSGGWQPVPLLATEVRVDAEAMRIEALSVDGTRHTCPLWELGVPTELLGATQAELDRFSVSDGGTTLYWPALECAGGRDVWLDLGDVKA